MQHFMVCDMCFSWEKWNTVQDRRKNRSHDKTNGHLVSCSAQRSDWRPPTLFVSLNSASWQLIQRRHGPYRWDAFKNSLVSSTKIILPTENWRMKSENTVRQYEDLLTIMWRHKLKEFWQVLWSGFAKTILQGMGQRVKKKHKYKDGRISQIGQALNLVVLWEFQYFIGCRVLAANLLVVPPSHWLI